MDSNRMTHLANLARLTVPEAEREAMAKDIENILSFVDTIQSVELGDREQVIADGVNIFRPDIAASIESEHDLVEAAPLHQDHYVKVPKVLE